MFKIERDSKLRDMVDFKSSLGVFLDRGKECDETKLIKYLEGEGYNSIKLDELKERAFNKYNQRKGVIDKEVYYNNTLNNLYCSNICGDIIELYYELRYITGK